MLLTLAYFWREIAFDALNTCLFLAGLRGAIAFALALRNSSTDARKAIITTTSLIVIVTVILIGGMTTQVLSWLGIP